MAKRIYLGGNPLSKYDFSTQNGFKGIILGEAITVDGNDFILTLDSENELSSTIKISIEGNTLKLTGANGKEQTVEIPTLDVSTLFSLRYDKDTKELVLSFKDGEERVSLEELVDVYEDGEGLKLENNVFSVDTTIIATVESVNNVKTELEASISEKVSSDDYNAKIEEIEANVESLTSDKANRSEIEDMLTKTEAADTYQPKGDYLTKHQDLSEYAKTSDVEEKLSKKQDKGDYVEWTPYGGQEGRRILKLAHRDTIAGESPKGGSQIAMVSDYDGLDFPVLELGGTKSAMVLNTNDQPVKIEITENGKRNQHIIATIDDLTGFAKSEDVTSQINSAVENKADKSELESYTKSTEFENLHGNVEDLAGEVATLEADKINDLVNTNGLTIEKQPLASGEKNLIVNIGLDEKIAKISTVTLPNGREGVEKEVVEIGNTSNQTVINSEDRLIVKEDSEYNEVSYVKDVDSLKSELTTYINALLKNYNLKSDEEIVKVLKAGGDVVVPKDIKAESGYTFTKNSNIDLNGHSLDAVSNGSYGDNIVLGGANVVLSNGEIKPAENASQASQSATILVKTANESHLTLNDVKVTGFYPIYLNSANENSTITINGGEYYTIIESDDPNKMNPSVYCGKGSTGSLTGGKVTINGGTFGRKGVVNNYLLNVEDILRKQEGKEPRDFIEVFGGQYWNFSPMDNGSEGPHTNFVADGYHVESKQDGEDILYTVVKDSE